MANKIYFVCSDVIKHKIEPFSVIINDFLLYHRILTLNFSCEMGVHRLNLVIMISVFGDNIVKLTLI